MSSSTTPPRVVGIPEKFRGRRGVESELLGRVLRDMRHLQFPPPAECAHRRLLVVRALAPALLQEGLGAHLSILASALAEGLHTNRTVVLPLAPLPLFRMPSRCKGDGPHGGELCLGTDGWGCFFEAISLYFIPFTNYYLRTWYWKLIIYTNIIR